MNWEALEDAPHHLFLQGEGFYISYNPRCVDFGMSIFGGGEITEETALIKEGEHNIYYILNGDWRKQYEKLFSLGFNACYEFYLKNKKKHGSKWSSDCEDDDVTT